MTPSVFIDSSVLIRAKERPDSNSAKILELLDSSRFRAIISAKVVREVHRYFRLYYDRQTANNYRFFLLQACKVVEAADIQPEIRRWRGKIKEKDLEHLATAKALELERLVAFDKDFEGFPEYTTPKQFIASLGLKPAKTEY